MKWETQFNGLSNRCPFILILLIAIVQLSSTFEIVEFQSVPWTDWFGDQPSVSVGYDLIINCTTASILCVRACVCELPVQWTRQLHRQEKEKRKEEEEEEEEDSRSSFDALVFASCSHRLFLSFPGVFNQSGRHDSLPSSSTSLLLLLLFFIVFLLWAQEWKWLLLLLLFSWCDSVRLAAVGGIPREEKEEEEEEEEEDLSPISPSCSLSSTIIRLILK